MRKLGRETRPKEDRNITLIFLVLNEVEILSWYGPWLIDWVQCSIASILPYWYFTLLWGDSALTEKKISDSMEMKISN